MNEYERMTAAGTFALDQITRYANAQIVIGKCDCDPECQNVNVTMWRLPQESDTNSNGVTYPVASVSSPVLWEALIGVYKTLVQRLDAEAAKQAARDIEIEYLKNMWEQ